MANKREKMERAKDKFSGKVKETTGKITGNEQLELKGKIQSKRADIKEDIAGKINDGIDKAEDKE